MTLAPTTLVLGQISGLYGVRGWVKVHSYTQPKDNILSYTPWIIRGQPVELEAGKEHGKTLVVKFHGIDDREAAAGLIHLDISVDRQQLPPLPAGEFYWIELMGLRVVTLAGVELGRVTQLLETGANDVLVVQGERERLLPYLPGQVLSRIDLAAGLIEVDWDPDF